MTQRVGRTLSVMLTAQLLLPSLASAQGVSLAFINGRSGAGKGLGNLHGVQATMARSLGDTPMSVRLAANFMTGTDESLGVLWSDLAIPVAAQPINRQRDLTTVSVGIGHFAFRQSPVMLQTYADFVGGFVRGNDRIVGTRESQDASKFTGGVRGGVEAHWQPSRTTPLLIQSGFSLERVKPLPLTNCADCWMPFDNSFNVVRLYAGVVLGPQTRRQRP